MLKQLALFVIVGAVMYAFTARTIVDIGISLGVIVIVGAILEFRSTKPTTW